MTHPDHYIKSDNYIGTKGVSENRGVRESKGVRESVVIMDSKGVAIPSVRGRGVSASHYMKRGVRHCVCVCVCQSVSQSVTNRALISPQGLAGLRVDRHETEHEAASFNGIEENID